MVLSYTQPIKELGENVEKQLSCGPVLWLSDELTGLGPQIGEGVKPVVHSLCQPQPVQSWRFQPRT